MSGFGDAVRYLYSQFILRDILSFITPGAIIVVAATYTLFPEIFSDYYVPWPLYIPLFGFFYMIGYAVQCLQVLCGHIRIHKKDESTFIERIGLIGCKWQTKVDIYKIPREKTIQFLNVAHKAKWTLQHRERSIVLKQMSANSFGAIIIAGILLLTDRFCTYQYSNIIMVSIVGFLFLLSLLFGYRTSEFAVCTTEREVIRFSNNRELNEDK